MRVLLTGASGFIGGELLSALEAEGHLVTSVGRTALGARPSHLVADLRRDDLRASLAEQDFVIHAASTTQGTASMLWRGNVDTTRRLVAAAARRDLPVVYISTTGVYGRSFGRFGDPDQMSRRPTSELSIARAAAEDAVLEAGGSVVRPHVVHGPGDRWVVPPLTGFMLRESAWLGGSNVKVAAISARRLAIGTVSLLDRATLPRALHAAEPAPVPVARLVRSAFRASGRPLPRRILSIEEAYERLQHTGVSRNALSMLGRASCMDSSDFWGQGTPRGVSVSAPVDAKSLSE